MRHAPRLLLAVSCALTVAVGCAGPRPTPDAALAWSPCRDAPDLQCATIQVPLDHDDPAGAAVTLPMVRIPAAEPGRRLGAVVLHRGGPGYSGVDYVRALHAGGLPAPLNTAALDRYDVIGYDQRGIGGSVPAVRCFASDDEQRRFGVGLPAFPSTDAERAARAAADAEFAARCRQTSGALLDHLTSAHAARDLDAIRAALGAPRLHLLGQSYGTYLAAVYANLFPDRIGRFVLDSVLDPQRQTAGGPGTVPSERTEADVASEATLAEFLRLCAEAGERCPFGQGEPAAVFERLVQRLRAEPVRLTAPGGRELLLTHQLLLAVTGGLLYQPDIWAGLALTFAQSVLVADDPRADPSTPLASAARLHAALPQSRLVVNEGWGHVTTQQSSCAVEAISAFLLDGRLPAEGATCRPDHTPFG